MANILILAQGTGGDVYPFVKLGGALKERGHEVTLAVNRDFFGMVKDAGIECVCVDPTPRFEEWRREVGAPDTIDSFRTYFMQKTISIVEHIEQLYAPQRSAIVSHWGLQLPVQLAADKLGISYLPIFISPYFMLGVSILREIFDTNSDDVNYIRAAIGLSPVRDWYAWLTTPRRGIGLWPDWYTSPGEGWVSELETVGFIWHEKIEMGELPAEVRNMIEEGEPPVLITHGTSIPINREFFKVGADACRLAGLRGLIVKKQEELVEGCLGDEIRFYSYLPFGSLMPHMSAVIHHGGIGTSAQAIAAGVPQIVLPSETDRPDNAERLKQLNVAEYFAPRDWQPGTVCDALLRLVNSSEAKKNCKALSRRVSREAPVEAACRVIEDFCRREDRNRRI